jgi:hypothetical protein
MSSSPSLEAPTGVEYDGIRVGARPMADDAAARPTADRDAGSTGEAPTTGGPAPECGAPTFSQKDAEELRARRAADAKLEARLRGWNPLTLWYAFWAIAIAIGALSSLGSGQVGAALLGAGICAACVKYTHYLYNGGRRRVWFFIW